MSVVPLELIEPANGAKFAATGSVHMRGSAGAPGPAGLFFKWYSSLSADPLSTALDFTANLKTGSQIITFSAKDVAGDQLADITSVQRAGMAGGPAVAQSPCIIHVFLANLVRPAAPGAPVSKAAPALAAEAPYVWDKPDYQAIDRLQYRFRFAPLGPPAGRAPAEIAPTRSQLAFRPVQAGDPPNTVPQVQFTSPLPAALGTGNYTLTLRVEDAQDSATGHEVSRSIVLNP
jgi:hypothetical protein